MTTFPDVPAFTGFNTPSRVEANVHDLNVVGTIPAEMDGAFYRVQPEHQFPPKLGDDIAFNGDGMISMFRFKDGRVDFTQRWAKTDKWKLENEAGRAVFGAYRNPLTDDEAVKGKIRGTANTNAYIHGGRLYALKEDSPALVMDAVTLETAGYTDFDGKMKGETFTAHPKTDPATGNLCGFGYASKGILTRDMAYYEISPQGELLYDVWFETPYYCMMHDFAITPDYALFSVMGMTSNWDRLKAGKPHFGFDTSLPSYLAVMPRKPGTTAADIRWFKGGNCFTAHVMNAFQEGTRLHLDLPVAANNMMPFFPDIDDAPFDPVAGSTFLTRWTVDLSQNEEEFKAVRLSDMIGEFPKIDDRFTGQKNRYGWMVVIDPSQPVELKGGSAGGWVMNTLGFVDLETGQEQKWWAGPVSSIQEPCFVPRSPDAAEGDGWIVMVCNRLETRSSDLLIFDATEIAKGPIATINIPVRLRFGLHGNWADAAQIHTLSEAA
ncbi:carotenoid oxygenase family protein [Novosphingobium sp. NBM11]|uniref:carotenoid oxygenase family protein n=1 Tax=unclassified Novosphingobium TaxID=2644732 RepID=UPI00061B8C51|nr:MULTISPECIES: carotenoid oxygenase family protein [unclassified Novosphingobium]MBF5088804.1 carotenoid oxygenase family protein [Novosphingobium sp. NBM11]GAO56429.1 lignostilbene-alpha,beta-dioxygenase and related enzymes [Novosphingobium sp. MD-1]